MAEKNDMKTVFDQVEKILRENRNKDVGEIIKDFLEAENTRMALAIAAIIAPTVMTYSYLSVSDLPEELRHDLTRDMLCELVERSFLP